VKDCTFSNSCLPSGLVQAYWYVGTAQALPDRAEVGRRVGTLTRRLPMMRHQVARRPRMWASVTFAGGEREIVARRVRGTAVGERTFAVAGTY
jgi:hypothetical protein